MLHLLAGTLGGPRITLAGQGIVDISISPTNATATLTIKSDGTYSKTLGGSETSLGNWVEPVGAAALFEYQATETSGALTSGTTGSWVTGNQSWTVSQTSIGTSLCDLQIDVRRVGGSTNVSSQTFSFEATKEL